ncbi:RNA polymerase I-specific transcription initiation factor RRN3-domain-containing protein, partial [Haematococcus lacustris]
RKKVERGTASEQLLANLIHALKNCVSILRERKHDSILTEVLGIKLWEALPVVRAAVLDFVGHLVVMNPAFTHSCLHLLVYSFLPPAAPQAEDAGKHSWQPPAEHLEIQACVLNTLLKVMALVPTAPTILLHLVSANIPHRSRDRNTQCMFLHALFTVAEAPVGRPIRDGLLAAAVEHLLGIDVEIKWEDIVESPSVAGQEAEEEEVELPGAAEAAAEDIFALEGMSELEISGRHHANAPACAPSSGLRGGWEGAASMAGHASAAATPAAVPQDAVAPCGADASARDGSSPGSSQEAEEEEVELPGAAEAAAEDIFALEGMSELEISGRHHANAPACAPSSGLRGGWEGAASMAGHASAAATPAAVPQDATANKLDSLMELAFAHLATRCDQAGGLQAVWEVLLAIFERSILNTHRSKFSQYLVFFMCYRHPEPCARTFIDFHLSRLHDDRQAPITRTACAAYLASFLARAAFVTPQQVLHALSQLTQFCHTYCRGVGSGLRQVPSTGSIVLAIGPGAGAGAQGSADAANSLTTTHQVLYASVQALLYVLCYHLGPMMTRATLRTAHGPSAPGAGLESPSTPAAAAAASCHVADSVKRLVREGIMPLLSHWLQPLNVCLPSVVLEFKRQLVAHGVADVTALDLQDRALTHSQRPLEMFFPFDPFLLRRSSRFLELKLSYVRWRQGHPQAAPSSARLQGDSDDEEVEEAEVGQAKQVEDDLELDCDSDSDTTSTDSEDESCPGNSLPSDTVLARPHLDRMHKAHSQPAFCCMQPPCLHAGSKHPAQPPGSFDSMGLSFSPGHVSGMTPTGSSPVIVEYISSTMANGASPMQMTPVFSHMLLKSHIGVAGGAHARH